ncbi:GH32 C-terminal domain-containing protein [Microbacterium sp. bgisy189]|uniref:GH32 C-terminal domain-containing protein n=1 Tax=Microbacterium sp. bgisy189 TaxID=3413798 RepID=UPI003EBBEC17
MSHPIPARTRPSIAKRVAATAAATALALTGAIAATGAAAAADELPGDERFRPQVHFTPAENWMNDPNGMVYVDGTYHLFFQHNPDGTRWGNMSWGHATSDDLLHWEEQPIAIPQTFDESGSPIESIFSGSIVVDEHNTSGFGVAGQAPLVAIYTSAYEPAHPTHAGIQAQSLAYSTDNGTTWTKYEGNPVLDRGSANFRDPKVFWYDGPAGAYWVMVAVEALDHKVVLYRSDDLRSWEHLSDFGPANSTGGIWECPDLFELPVDGDPERTKWVMVVNLNPGAVAGGSGGQYFVGDFDGTTFTSESTDGPSDLPAGEVYAGFDDGTYEGWTVSNEPGNRFDGPWTAVPATGTMAGQNTVTGFAGEGLVNGFADGDWPVGTLESPTFTITSDAINLLVGGGRHPHVDGTQLGNEPPAGATVFDFELPDGQDLSQTGWQLTGDFATEPTRNPSTAGGDYYLGQKRVNTWEGGPNGDDNVGLYTSPEFTLDGDVVSFLIGGGKRTDGTLQAELVVDGEVVRTQTGSDAGQLNWASWDVASYRGSTAQLRIRDEATGGWGHLTFDHVVVGDTSAQVRSDETSVSLVVDGEVVRTATGADSETLDWVGWDVRAFAGKDATIRIVDNNRFGWGHILVDQIMFADTPAAPRLEGYDWLDWGRDYYAAVSYFGTPTDGSRIMQGWMNNWDYANDIPTSTWRSSMSLPREVTLVSTPDGPRLRQQVVAQVGDVLDTGGAATRTGVSVDGQSELGLSGEVAKVEVVLRPGSAEQAGITVFGDGDTGTRIGYDRDRGRLFVDRRASGEVDFHPAFASIEDAPVELDADGTVRFELYLDRASVELFAADGTVTITDQVFPAEGADMISAWSEGGAAVLERITVTPLEGTMWSSPDDGAAAAPARGILSHDNGWDTGLADGAYTVTMNLWWGENASSFRLFENGELVATVPLTHDGERAQRATVPISGRANGTYAYTGELVNSKGVTATSTVTVTVTQANPARPVLSHDNWDGDGDFRLTANLWWGTNATSYRVYEGDTLLAEGPLTAATPGAQRATFDVRGAHVGSHVYRVEFANAVGATSSNLLAVQVRR